LEPNVHFHKYFNQKLQSLKPVFPVEIRPTAGEAFDIQSNTKDTVSSSSSSSGRSSSSGSSSSSGGGGGRFPLKGITKTDLRLLLLLLLLPLLLLLLLDYYYYYYY